MSCRNERQMKCCFVKNEPGWFAEVQHMFDSFTAHSRSQKPRSWRAQNNFAVIFDMIGMRMADKDSFTCRLWFVRIQPQTTLGQMNTAAVEFDAKTRHRAM